MLACAAGQAEAQELREFQEAQSAYQQADYSLAVQMFEALVGTDPPVIQDPVLLAESRKYLGASYLFVGRRDEAERQFSLLLAANPDYPVDPTLPQEVKRVFSSVRERVESQRRIEEDRRRREEEVRRQREIQEIRLRHEREMQLRELARTETIEVHNSRWLALLPFGVGQFQNRDEGLGWTLLISQGLLAATSVVSAILWNSLTDEHPSGADRAEAEQLEQSFRLTNQVSTALFWSVAAIGIVDAQLRFEPVHRSTRLRDLPPELQPGTLDVSVGLGGASLKLHF